MLEMRTHDADACSRAPPRRHDGRPTARPRRRGDSAALQTSPFQQMIAQAEILVPGFRVPTFDSALPRAKTVDSMCATRRSGAGRAHRTTDGAALLASVSDDGFDVAARRTAPRRHRVQGRCFA
jgi:hypothetical protein